MRRRIRGLSRMRNRYLLGLDVAIFTVSPLIAFYLRTESVDTMQSLGVELAYFTLAVMLLKITAFLLTEIYSEFWPYASVDALLTLIRSSSLAMGAELILFYAILIPLRVVPPGFPPSIPLIDGIISMTLVGGVRLSIRVGFALYANQGEHQLSRPVIIAGAGVAGAMTVRELQTNKQIGLMPVGFVDDDPLKQGRKIHGVHVLGPLNALPEIVAAKKAKEVIIAMPMAPGPVIRQVVHLCRDARIPTKTIPGIFEILRGTAKVDQIRNIQLEDLLRRGAVKTETAEVARILHAERVLVTGAGGSIGSELCRQIKDFGPSDLILLGHGENSIFEIGAELLEVPRHNLTMHKVIADIRDFERMEQVFETYRPTIVFHAAAHKHVPLMEENPVEAVTNNVLGTRNVVELCEKYDVKRFVLISSDKAVNPTSYMGATKRVAELVVQDVSCRKKRNFVTVRFGNVLGSRGSVVPFFKRQIELGGPVTITHPEVRRYFMTIPEAVQLVLQAAAMGSGCEVFVLDMGEQIKVVDLARDMIRLSGLEEGRDIEIKYIGLRPGEKMYEELFLEGETRGETAHDKITVSRNGFPEFMKRKGSGQEDVLGAEMESLINAARTGALDTLEKTLMSLVPEFRPANSILHDNSSDDSSISAIEEGLNKGADVPAGARKAG
jgi:FlaA1/EpsC-like NDP-sugar epimerase